MPQNPTRQVHALLGAESLKTRWQEKRHTIELPDQILHRNKLLAITLTNTRHENENTAKQRLELVLKTTQPTKQTLANQPEKLTQNLCQEN